MFFDITHHKDARFPYSIALGKFVINVDAGWKQTATAGRNIIYKGYCDIGILDNMLPQIMAQVTPDITGNFCVLEYDPECDTLTIKTDRYRAFPLYHEPGESITNLRARPRVVWSDRVVTVDSDLAIQEHIFDVIGFTQPDTCTVDRIHQYLTAKIQRFLACNTLPIRVFLSGGVDTTLLYSYLTALDVPHQVVWCSHVDHDYFYLGNHGDLKQHWAYQQIHHWHDPCVLVSGTPGDEFTMRSPTTANLWLLANDTSMPEQLIAHPTCLHHNHFSKPKQMQGFHRQAENWKMPDDLIWHLCNINVNDWQHWHLGNTLTWTPLRDLELFKMFLALPPDKILSQIMCSEVSIDLIERNQPGLSTVISDSKNTGNAMMNLRRLLAQH